MNDGNRDSGYSNEPEGRFADRFKIGYRQSVFILEFGQSCYEDEKVNVLTEIITSPEDLKVFLKLLQNSIKQYEKNYGPTIVKEKD